MRIRNWGVKGLTRGGSVRLNYKMMNCIRPGEQMRVGDRISSSESLAPRDYSPSGISWRTGEDADHKLDSTNIEEAESSLRESGFLNYEEARALLGRLEYQKGNVEAALQVFQGIDIAAMTPRIKLSLSTTSRHLLKQRHSQIHLSSPTIMSPHAVTLLFEAIFLKAKSLQALGRYTEAAQSCKVILDIVESALPQGFKLSFRFESKLHEILNKTIELFPELWKLASASQEAILAYRKALLYNWNLDIHTRTRIQKEFAIFLLYSGCDASPPTLQSQAEGSFIPRNNIEESVLLLMVILRKFILGKIEWDSSVLDHLCFALSIGGDLMAFAHCVEELPPEIMGRKETYNTLALSYYAQGNNNAALNLLRNLLNGRGNSDVKFELLLASKVCLENNQEEGMNYLRSLTSKSSFRCNKLTCVAKFLSGRLLAAQSRRITSDSEKIRRHSESIEMLEAANGDGNHPDVLYHLSLEKAEQRKLEDALCYGKRLLKLEAGSSMKTWIHLARVLSAQKRYVDAENIINAALDETGKWEQGELLRTKAKLQIAQGHLRDAVDSYTRLLAVLHVRRKGSFGLQKKHLKGWGQQTDRSLEMETWHDLADVYTSLSQWRDTEICLGKSKAINPHSASRWHSTGLYYKAKGEQKEALDSFGKALDVEPNHIPSLISTAIVLREMNVGSSRVARSFLADALRLDRTNPLAWYNLGMTYKDEATGKLTSEAAECFQAATFLQDSAPVEPFFFPFP